MDGDEDGAGSGFYWPLAIPFYGRQFALILA